MANKCRNLKSIGCGFYINDQNSDIRQLLSHLKAFPALKRLDLLLSLVRNEEEEDVNQLFSFELFKGFSNITHLSLRFGLLWLQTLKESILKDIDIYLPNLQYLEMKDIFLTTPEGVQQMGDILSRLSRLETLKLKLKSGVDFNPIKDKISEKCKKIRKTEIYSF